MEIMADSTITKFTKFTKFNGAKIASKTTVGGTKYSTSQKAFYGKDVLDEYDRYVLQCVPGLVRNTIGVDLYEGAKNEALKSDGYYYWQFDTVVGGEKRTLTAKVKYSSTIEGLKAYHVQELRYAGEYVTAVKDVEASKFYTNTALTINKQDIYDVGRSHCWCDGYPQCRWLHTAWYPDQRHHIVFDGRTLYTNYGYADVGLAVAPDAKAVLVQNEGILANYERKVYSCGSLSEAFGHLADADTTTPRLPVQGRVVAVLNSAGVAQWVVLISDTQLVIGGGSCGSNTGLFNEFTMVSANNYEVRYYGSKTLAETQNLVVEVVERNTGMAVRNYNPVTNMPIFEDYPFMPVTVTAIHQLAIKLDGTIVAYFNYNDASEPAESLTTTGAYLLKGSAPKSSPDLTSGSNSVTVTSKTADLEYVSAYQVTLNNSMTATYKDAIGTDQPLTSTPYVAKGTTLAVTGNDTSSNYRQFTVNGNKYGTMSKGDGSSKSTMSYTVNATTLIGDTWSKLATPPWVCTPTVTKCSLMLLSRASSTQNAWIPMTRVLHLPVLLPALVLPVSMW